jgi:hypothetical protein
MPEFFKQWLDSLTDEQTEAMYEWVVAATDNAVGYAIQDIVAPRATAEPE